MELEFTGGPTPDESSSTQREVETTKSRENGKEQTNTSPAKTPSAGGDSRGSSRGTSTTVNSWAATSGAAESSKRGVSREFASANRTSPQLAVIGLTSSPIANQTERYPIPFELPKWYTEIKTTGLRMKELSKKRPQAASALEALKNCVGRCEIELRPNELFKLYEELRNHIHKAEITLEVDRYILRMVRILDVAPGLPRIFKEDAKFPADIKADSYQLYSRWLREDFSKDLLRGIVTVKGKNRDGDRLDKKYREKHYISPKFYGEGHLVLGQWWPTQLCTVRDGAHGATQGGISGDKENGTYSIVLSGGGGYHDKDDGDFIEYSGTDGKEHKPTEATLMMVTSAELGNDIRVIRSSQLHRNNKYRPQLGLRYDGLYKIKSFKIVHEEKQIHRFHLERCPGQQPIRCGENAARRPTVFETVAYQKLKLLPPS
ncbi:PUA-like domain-containing protein [Phaeosphaeriaceae sp. PMI808]|nr:PUA-like domain-containing protein [Phaeosphaeriaceae sp. PMI808]